MKFALVLVAAAVVLGASRGSQAYDAPAGPPVRQQVMVPASDFTLTNQDGRAVRLADLRGKPVLLTFIYTTCPDVCPLITADMVRIQRLVKARGGPEAIFLSITTDPEVDRPDVLKAYAERHGVDLATWALLTGTTAELQPVWNAYSVKVTRRARGLVDHTGVSILIDRLGRIRYRYRGWSLDTPTVVADLERLNAEAKR
jgi:protein SCO1/2